MGRAGELAAAAAALICVTFCAFADMPEKLAPCLACHGATGQSEIADVPSLGGQPAAYSAIQLFLFREKLRVAKPMNELTRELSDDGLSAMAEALAQLPPPRPPADPGDPARLDRARALARQHHCDQCHRPDYSGQQNVPLVANQREDYLLKSLRDYKSGARPGYDSAMADALQPLGDAQLVEFAYYLAHLR